jgi:aryl-alcohol dehydrogenase-like predicted oxidoreductase
VEQIQLGRTGLQVSRLCLGTANFGWQCDLDTAGAILDRAADAGVNFIDTADAYQGSEEVLGQLLKGRRDDFIVATKGGGPVGSHPWDIGTSRKHLLDAIDASLRRLDVDYVDVYFTHLYDSRTPLDETLEALDFIVHSGRARYIGCSNYLAYQVARSLGRSETRNLARFVAVQPRYNLVSRQIELELLPLCSEESLAVIAYNPLAGGVLAGKHDRAAPPPDDGRFGEKAGFFGAVYRSRYWHDQQFDTVDQLSEIADEVGVPLATLSVAWLLARSGVTGVLVGASRPDQLAATLAASDLILDADVTGRIDAVTAHWRTAEG